MAKKKTETLIITDWNHADDILRDIGDLERQIQEAERMATEQINATKEAFAADIKPRNQQIKYLKKSLQAFATKNKADFRKARSVTRLYGKLGWRKSSSISITTKDDLTLNAIKNYFGRKAKGFLRIKETVDKEALEKLTDEQLKVIAARRKNRDEFFVEPATAKTREDSHDLSN